MSRSLRRSQVDSFRKSDAFPVGIRNAGGESSAACRQLSGSFLGEPGPEALWLAAGRGLGWKGRGLGHGCGCRCHLREAEIEAAGGGWERSGAAAGGSWGA